MWGQGSRVSCYTWGLEVERDHLATGVPEDLRHVITGVHAASFGVDTAHLTFVVAAEMLRIFFFFLQWDLKYVCYHVCIWAQHKPRGYF